MKNQLKVKNTDRKYPSNNSQRIWVVAIVLITLGTVALRYAIPIKDGDTWYHILYGKYFFENRTLIADHSIFSWTPSNTPIIYCTWLSDIFFYLYYQLAGLPGLYALRYICVYGLLGLGFIFARKVKIILQPVTWFICFMALLMSYAGINAKPEIFSFVLMSLFAWNWWSIRLLESNAWKRCYFFPLIMLVWVNSHGGFIFGMVFMATITVGELLNTRLCPNKALSSVVRKHLLISSFLTVLTMLLNPYGYTYLIQLILDCIPSGENMEGVRQFSAYQSPFDGYDQLGLVMLFKICLCCLLYLYLRNLRKIEWSELLTNVTFIFLYTFFLRTTFFWAPIFLFSSLSLLAQSPLIPSKCPRWVSTQVTPILLLCLTIFLSGFILHKAFYTPEMGCWMGFGVAESNPVTEAEYIKKNYPTAKIGNTYNQGAYLMWELWPENTVFIDSRYFPYKSWLNEYFSMFHGTTFKDNPALFSAYINKQACDLWCIGHNLTGVSEWFFRDPQWKLAYYGKNASVFIRNDMPLPPTPSNQKSDLKTVQNLAIAIDALQWTMVIQDCDATDILLARMRQTAAFSEEGQRISSLERLAALLKEKGASLSFLTTPNKK
jgi:hypothetical protein